MLSLLLLYAITQSASGEAIPISSIEARDPSGNGGLIQTRTIWNIVWSCLSTIFLCTWGSLHPNISSTPDEPGMGRHDKLRKCLVHLLTYKLPLFLWALLVPEYILAWAIRQYLTAGEIEKKGTIFILVPLKNVLKNNSSRMDENTRILPGNGGFPAVRAPAP
jgi:hypothetical protein